MKRKRKQVFESYNHRILWCAARKNFELAKAKANSIDGKYCAFAAMLMSYLAFEGYLNWLGSRICPDIWDGEREFFSRKPFQGTLGKHLFLATILHLPKPDVSRRPYQTAIDLGKFRNSVTHSRPERGETMVMVAEGMCPKIRQSEWGKKVSLKTAQHALDDLAILTDQLHAEARSFFSDSIPEQQALEGMLGRDITDLSVG